VAEPGAFVAGLWCLEASGIAGAGFQPAFLQLLFGLLFLLPVAALFYRFDHLQTGRLGRHAAVAALTMLSLACLCTALARLGVPLTLGIAAGGYMALSCLLSRRPLAAVASIVSLLLLAALLAHPSGGAVGLSLLLPLAAGVLRLAAERQATHHLAAEPRGTRLFYGLLLPLPLGAVPALLSWQPAPPTAWPWLLLAGLALALGHLLGRLAGPDRSGLATPPPGPLALLWSLSLLSLLPGQTPPLDRLTLTGLATIVLVTGLSLSSGRREAKARKT
jgi:hypothetical protein